MRLKADKYPIYSNFRLLKQDNVFVKVYFEVVAIKLTNKINLRKDRHIKILKLILFLNSLKIMLKMTSNLYMIS